MLAQLLGALISNCLHHFFSGLGSLPVPRDTDKSCAHCQHSKSKSRRAIYCHAIYCAAYRGGNTTVI